MTVPEARAENARLFAEHGDNQMTLSRKLRCISCSERSGGLRIGYQIAAHEGEHGKMWYCNKCLAPIGISLKGGGHRMSVDS